MVGSLSWFGSDDWPEDGWPYADASDGPLDNSSAPDDDLISIHTLATHLLDGLGPLERQVVTARFGLDGRPARSMKQIQHDTGLPRGDLRVALGDGLAKLRTHLA